MGSYEGAFSAEPAAAGGHPSTGHGGGLWTVEARGEGSRWVGPRPTTHPVMPDLVRNLCSGK
jgi:hypothetical protein